jgi:hypothetical protein
MNGNIERFFSASIEMVSCVLNVVCDQLLEQVEEVIEVVDEEADGMLSSSGIVSDTALGLLWLRDSALLERLEASLLIPTGDISLN